MDYYYGMEVVTKLTEEEIRKNKFSIKQSLCATRSKKLDINRTKAERSFLYQLKQTDIKYQFQKGFIAGCNFAIADFYFPDYKIVLEIDGGYHNTPKQQIRDKYRTEYLNKRGVRVIRISNKQAFEFKFYNLYKLLGVVPKDRKHDPFAGC